MAGEEQELTPEQLAEAIRGMKISDLLLSTVTTLAHITYAKLEGPTRDLEQARIGVDSIKALLEILRGTVSEEASRDLGQMLANLQLAYASAAAQKPDGDG